MKTASVVLRSSDPAAVTAAAAPLAALAPQIVLVFGTVALLRDARLLDALRAALPTATAVGCSTAGEITPHGVETGTVTVTALAFEQTPCRVVGTAMAGLTDSRAAGARLGDALAADPDGPRLAAVLMFGRGTDMNGSALIDGLMDRIGSAVPVCGGLAGDDGAFSETVVIGGPDPQAPVAVGLYGEAVRLGLGSVGGWQPFGPTRRVTGCTGNILHSLDDEPALDVYRRYLGDYARDLPASGLLFPFEMLDAQAAPKGLIRTILGIDEATGSLILAGDVDATGYLRMMSASTDALVAGAEKAAAASRDAFAGAPGGLALLVSCVGRKLVMGDRVDEEVEAVVDVLGGGLTVAGFYSYGELGPHAGEGACRLHNQTMTVAVVAEA